MKAINLQTEYLTNPIGIDVQRPRLFWNCEGGNKQTAYQIIAKTDGEVVWESGIVETNRMTETFPVTTISRQRVEWQVCLRDENGVWGDFSSVAFFEMGLLKSSDWQAKWIKGDYVVNKRYRYPTDHFQKIFSTNDIIKARLYVTACGIYQVSLNGFILDEFVCAPGHTDYRKRIQYQTYDVTDLINCGENVINIEVADGWYRGAQGAWGHTYIYGKETKLFAQLEILHKDGTLTVIPTDETFLWANNGIRLFADLKEGEVVDANNSLFFEKHAKTVRFNASITASNNFPVKKHEKFSPTLITTPSGNKVLDFGQNISGFIGFSIIAKKGQKLFLRMGEMLDNNGEFTQDNVQLAMKKSPDNMKSVRFADNGKVLNVGQFDKGKVTPLQMLEYTCRKGKNTYESTFALYGFRYVLVETDIDFSPSDFYSVAVYSDFIQTGYFECSNTLVNRFVDCTLWSAKSNSADVPTDCPTRERSGWTGDSQVFFDSASYLLNYQPFARKHVKDITDRQARNGKFHQIVPKGGEDFWMATMNGSVGWADAGVLIPYRMWKKYGDTNVIKDNFEAMDRYASFMMKRTGAFSILAKPITLSRENKKYLVNKGQSYGEWAEPQDVNAFAIGDFINPHPEESTAYTVFVMRCMQEIAVFLGKEDKARTYAKYAEGCKKAYQELVTKKNFSLDTDRQAKLVRPLYLNLLTDEQADFAKKRLVRALDNYGWRLGTGFLSTPFILYVLTKINPEYAYRLLENEECPGWLFMPKNGATTVWEAWEGNSTKSRGIASLNHYSKGAVCSWLFDSVAGINIGKEPNTFIIKPIVGGTLTYAKASYSSIYGKVVSGWQKAGDKILFEVEIPSNTTAEIILTDDAIYQVESGKHSFSIDYKEYQEVKDE